jgi:hypothetical protein
LRDWKGDAEVTPASRSEQPPSRDREDGRPIASSEWAEVVPHAGGEPPSVDAVIERCTASLHTIIDLERDLLRTAIAATRSRKGAVAQPGDAERTLRQGIVEAVEILDKTRKSFKSRQLEQLRLRLLRILET